MTLKNSLCLSVQIPTLLIGFFLGLPIREAKAEPDTCVTTQAGQVICGKPHQKNNNLERLPDSTQNFQLEDNDFRLELKGCIRNSSSNNNNIKCDLLVTNLFSKDRSFWLNVRRSRMISLGNEFNPSEAQLGLEKGTWPALVLVYNVPIKGSITFKEIPYDVNIISILDISYGNDGGMFRFSNVNIRNSSRKASVPHAVQATDNSSAVKLGTIKSQDPQARINVRDKPSLNGYNRHYGIAGDRVVILSSTRSDGYTWYKIKFPTSGAEGWVRGDFINVND